MFENKIQGRREMNQFSMMEILWGGQHLLHMVWRTTFPKKPRILTFKGFTLGSQICLGYIASDTPEKLAPEHVLSTSYEIEIAQKRFQCRLNLHSPSLPMM